ncbi:hypothetical protein [Magnetofaba australis]|uniref:Uncharacterized protein n=1 Tax=Magnetofaba australis IT-1 TaxID=1434232 RepID=A0A1Y2K426_9PROT|nr:hypothetical protein [Magnetofaba australis]OSM03979.1 hypothetical protein MAIT1_03772 [Magnetofaba australis IT-1]
MAQTPPGSKTGRKNNRTKADIANASPPQNRPKDWRYRAQYAAEVKQRLLRGQCLAEAAREMGFDLERFNRWLHQRPGFARAVDEAGHAIAARSDGAPMRYRPEYGEKIHDLMAEGCSLIEAAVTLGLPIDRFDKWRADHPAFAAALVQGERASRAWWLKLGREHLHDKSFNIRLWQENLKIRFDLTGKSEAETAAAPPQDHRAFIPPTFEEFLRRLEDDGVDPPSRAANHRNRGAKRS